MSSETINSEQLRDAFRVVAEKMKARSEELRVLDAACGDGDLGVTVTKGFSAIAARLNELEGDPPDRLLATLGMTFNNAAASTFGVFFATALMHASNCITGQVRFSVNDFCGMLEAAAEGIKTRGHADVGDRTILDALIPACAAARTALSTDSSFDTILSAATAAAKQGAADSAELLPKTGRARWLGDKVKGTQDPGATFVYFFLDACCNALHPSFEGSNQ